MSVPVPVAPADVVSERDKPFILLIITTSALIGLGAYAIVTGKLVEAQTFLGTITTLVSTGWGYYFSSKA